MSAVRDSGMSARVRISVDRRLLWVNDRPAVVGARAFDLLLALVARRDRIVGKNELLDLVWPRLVVEEANLHVQVSTLRKVLGPNCITTVPGRGYRFTGPIEGVDQTGGLAPMRSSADPAPAAVDLKTNLPESLPPLIGRADDLASLGGLVANHRLVTITGAGGMGKTRLAQHLLRRQRSSHEHGVCWVELDNISDPLLVAGTIASALGIRTGVTEPLAGLAAALKGLTLLVALDNAEHLADEVARVGETIIGVAPKLSLLVTSQAPLRCGSERVYRIGPLAVPDEVVPECEALAHGAVALFVERVQAADRHFELTADNVTTVIDICRQLDGMALAIELAAARVPMMGVAKLAATLNEPKNSSYPGAGSVGGGVGNAIWPTMRWQM